MRYIGIITAMALTLGACTHTADNEYWCSYEKTQAAYQNCMEVSEGIDKETAEAAGKREDH